MKNRLIALLLVMTTLLSLVLVSCKKDEAPKNDPVDTTEQTEAETENTEPKIELDKEKTYNILFVGNSYTEVNNIEKLVAVIANNAGYKMACHRAAKGGWSLIDSANPEDSNGKVVDQAFKTKNLDFVVLQEQSETPGNNPAKFYDGVRALAKTAADYNVTPILYSTWGRKAGNAALEKNGWTDDTMPYIIAAGYEAIGKELDIDVAWAGLAFYDVYKNNTEIDLYDTDLHHPSYAGSYLAAMTIFCTITGEDPTTINYNGKLTAEQANVLKAAAKKVVFNTPVIPAEYKTTSEGVTLAK